MLRILGDWATVEDCLEQNDEPVIVTITNPHLSTALVGDHAVVVWKFERDNSGIEFVIFMNPLTSNHERKERNDFLLWWNKPGARAFVLRP